jgi:hypothetical protein
VDYFYVALIGRSRGKYGVLKAILDERPFLSTGIGNRRQNKGVSGKGHFLPDPPNLLWASVAMYTYKSAKKIVPKTKNYHLN